MVGFFYSASGQATLWILFVAIPIRVHPWLNFPSKVGRALRVSVVALAKEEARRFLITDGVLLR